MAAARLRLEDSSDFATVPSGTEIGAGAEVYVDLAAIPAYSGEPYAIVNGNMPYFYSF